MSNIDKNQNNKKNENINNQNIEDCNKKDKKYDIWTFAENIEIQREGNQATMILSNIKKNIAYSLFANESLNNDKLAFNLSPNELEKRLNNSINENKDSSCKVEFQSDNKNVKVHFYLRSISYEENQLISNIEIINISYQGKDNVELTTRVIGVNVAANYYNLWQWCAPNFSPVVPYKIGCPKGYKLTCTNTNGSNCICVKKNKSKADKKNLQQPVCTGGDEYELTNTFKCLCKKKSVKKNK